MKFPEYFSYMTHKFVLSKFPKVKLATNFVQNYVGTMIFMVLFSHLNTEDIELAKHNNKFLIQIDMH